MHRTNDPPCLAGRCKCTPPPRLNTQDLRQAVKPALLHVEGGRACDLPHPPWHSSDLGYTQGIGPVDGWVGEGSHKVWMMERAPLLQVPCRASVLRVRVGVSGAEPGYTCGRRRASVCRGGVCVDVVCLCAVLLCVCLGLGRQEPGAGSGLSPECVLVSLPAGHGASQCFAFLCCGCAAARNAHTCDAWGILSAWVTVRCVDRVVLVS